MRPPAPISAQPFPKPDAALHELRYLVVDVETTGGSSQAAERVTELAAVEFSGGALSVAVDSLINPERGISPFVASLTGISNEMVRDAPLFSQLADSIAGQLEQTVFVAHNARFDLALVCDELRRAGHVVQPSAVLCTVRLARRLAPELRSRSLDWVARRYSVRIKNRHRALGDAWATAEVFQKMLNELGQQGVHSWEDLARFMERPRGRKRKRKRSALPTFFFPE